LSDLCPDTPHWHLYHPATYQAPKTDTHSNCDFSPFIETSNGTIKSSINGNVKLRAHIQELELEGLSYKQVYHRKAHHQRTGLGLLVSDQPDAFPVNVVVEKK